MSRDGALPSASKFNCSSHLENGVEEASVAEISQALQHTATHTVNTKIKTMHKDLAGDMSTDVQRSTQTQMPSLTFTLL